MSDKQYHMLVSEAGTSSQGDDDMSGQSTTKFSEFCDTAILNKQVESLYLSERCSDVLLTVEGNKFHAHKVILACRSDYFRAMFFGGMREETDGEVELHDTPVEAFRHLLRYIYSGKMCFSALKLDLALEIFGLANQYGFIDLEKAMCDYFESSLHIQNVSPIYGAAHLYSLTQLMNSCLQFMDKHAIDVMQSKQFTQLSGSALYDAISRVSFYAAEIDIFRVVARWIDLHPGEEQMKEKLLKSVLWQLITIADLLAIVRPSGLVDPNFLLDVIGDQIKKKSSELVVRGAKVMNMNVASSAFNAQVIEGDQRENLLREDSCHDIERSTSHEISDSERGIVVKLSRPFIINHIQLYLVDRDQRFYSYFVELSIDGTDWVRVIDHSKYLCRARQQLYFKQRVVKYIKIVGTRSSLHHTFYLSDLKAMFTTDPFLIDPDTTLLTLGVSRSRNALLNGDYRNYDWDDGYTCHQLGSGSIIIQLPQPYLIGSIRLLLWDCDDRRYSFNIEVSSDQQNWTQIIEATHLQSWQTFRFRMIPIVFVKIIGTFNSANEVFHCVHFECPAQTGLDDMELSSSGSSASVDYDTFPIKYGRRLDGFEEPQMPQGDMPVIVVSLLTIGCSKPKAPPAESSNKQTAKKTPTVSIPNSVPQSDQKEDKQFTKAKEGKDLPPASKSKKPKKEGTKTPEPPKSDPIPMCPTQESQTEKSIRYEPKKPKLNAKAQKILETAKKDKGAYPTIDDVKSDWDSENHSGNRKSKKTKKNVTNLESQDDEEKLA